MTTKIKTNRKPSRRLQLRLVHPDDPTRLAGFIASVINWVDPEIGLRVKKIWDCRVALKSDIRFDLPFDLI
jgi:hypothetical protein